MSAIATAILQIIAGAAVFMITWYVFDSVHDRNTEIILAAIGTVYTQSVVIARRQKLNLITLLYLFDKLFSQVKSELRDEEAADRAVKMIMRLGNLNLVIIALIELLCLYRLFTAILNRGWDNFSIPLRSILEQFGP
jgi:hypothetical protein